MNQKSEQKRNRSLIAFLALVALLLAFLLGRVSAPEAESSSPPVVQLNEPSPPQERDEAGAVDAATRFSRILTGPSGDPESYMKDITSIAAPDWTPRAQELAENSIDFVQERYGEGGTIDFEPLRYRVQSFSTDRAAIDLWGVVLASGPKLGGIEESWVTATIELQWVGSEWRVRGQASAGGPTPELLRTQEDKTVDEILSDFEEYSDAKG